jgi:uncharacterized cupin superfamily protein
MDGVFQRRKHDDTAPFFLVHAGRLEIEPEDRRASLKPGQAATVPRGVMHRPHSRGRSVVPMIEKAGVSPCMIVRLRPHPEERALARISRDDRERSCLTLRPSFEARPWRASG